MIAVPSIFMLFLTAVLSGVGVAVLGQRRQTIRILLAGAAMLELLMAIGLAFLAALPPTYF